MPGKLDDHVRSFVPESIGSIRASSGLYQLRIRRGGFNQGGSSEGLTALDIGPQRRRNTLEAELKVDRYVWGAQKGNRVQVCLDRETVVGTITAVLKGGDDVQYVVTRDDTGEEVQTDQAHMKRLEPPKRVRNRR